MTCRQSRQGQSQHRLPRAPAHTAGSPPEVAEGAERWGPQSHSGCRCRVTVAAPRGNGSLGGRARRASQRTFRVRSAWKARLSLWAEAGEGPRREPSTRTEGQRCAGRCRAARDGRGARESGCRRSSCASISEGTGPRGKITHVFQKGNLHALFKSKTNTLTVTAWPRRLRPHGVELRRTGAGVAGAGGAPRCRWRRPGPARGRHAARGPPSALCRPPWRWAPGGVGGRRGLAGCGQGGALRASGPLPVWAAPELLPRGGVRAGTSAALRPPRADPSHTRWLPGSSRAGAAWPAACC